MAAAMVRQRVAICPESSMRLRTPSTTRSRQGKSSAGWCTSPSAGCSSSRVESRPSLAVRSARWLIAIGLMVRLLPANEESKPEVVNV